MSRRFYTTFIRVYVNAAAPGPARARARARVAAVTDNRDFFLSFSSPASLSPGLHDPTISVSLVGRSNSKIFQKLPA